MTYKLQGFIKIIGEVQTFGSGFQKREVVITEPDSKYPQDISFEFCGDKVGVVDGYEVGDSVEISFGINGREYNGRYFNNLKAWALSRMEQERVVLVQAVKEALGGEVEQGEFDDDIPF